MVNPAGRLIDKVLRKERNSVGHRRRQRALESDAMSAAARELDGRIQSCDRAIESLARARRATDRHVRAGELSAEQHLPQPKLSTKA